MAVAVLVSGDTRETWVEWRGDRQRSMLSRCKRRDVGRY